MLMSQQFYSHVRFWTEHTQLIIDEFLSNYQAQIEVTPVFAGDSRQLKSIALRVVGYTADNQLVSESTEVDIESLAHKDQQVDLVGIQLDCLIESAKKSGIVVRNHGFTS